MSLYIYPVNHLAPEPSRRTVSNPFAGTTRCGYPVSIAGHRPPTGVFRPQHQEVRAPWHLAVDTSSHDEQEEDMEQDDTAEELRAIRDARRMIASMLLQGSHADDHHHRAEMHAEAQARLRHQRALEIAARQQQQEQQQRQAQLAERQRRLRLHQQQIIAAAQAAEAAERQRQHRIQAAKAAEAYYRQQQQEQILLQQQRAGAAAAAAKQKQLQRMQEKRRQLVFEHERQQRLRQQQQQSFGPEELLRQLFGSGVAHRDTAGPSTQTEEKQKAQQFDKEQKQQQEARDRKLQYQMQAEEFLRNVLGGVRREEQQPAGARRSDKGKQKQQDDENEDREIDLSNIGQFVEKTLQGFLGGIFGEQESTVVPDQVGKKQESATPAPATTRTVSVPSPVEEKPEPAEETASIAPKASEPTEHVLHFYPFNKALQNDSTHIKASDLNVIVDPTGSTLQVDGLWRPDSENNQQAKRRSSPTGVSRRHKKRRTAHVRDATDEGEEILLPEDSESDADNEDDAQVLTDNDDASSYSGGSSSAASNSSSAGDDFIQVDAPSSITVQLPKGTDLSRVHADLVDGGFKVWIDRPATAAPAPSTDEKELQQPIETSVEQPTRVRNIEILSGEGYDLD